MGIWPVITVDSGAVCVATSHFLHWEPLGRHPNLPPPSITHGVPVFLCSSADVHIHTNTQRGMGVGGRMFLWLNLCVCICAAFLFTPPQPRGTPPTAKGGSLCIHCNGGWDGCGEEEGEVDWVCCLKKKKGDRKKWEGEGWAALCLKREKGEEKERSRQARKEVRGWRWGEAGWLAGAVAGLCLWIEGSWANNCLCSSNN